MEHAEIWISMNFLVERKSTAEEYFTSVVMMIYEVTQYNGGNKAKTKACVAVTVALTRQTHGADHHIMVVKTFKGN